MADNTIYPNVMIECAEAFKYLTALVVLPRESANFDNVTQRELSLLRAAGSRLRNALRALAEREMGAVAEMGAEALEAESQPCEIHQVPSANLIWCKTHGRMWGDGAKANADEPCPDWQQFVTTPVGG